jgi:glycosyltransferase involved in cell wall biosynthesis
MLILDIEVFIITYNRKNLLEQSINSVLNQSYKPKRITIIDNGSSDGTDQICKKYLKSGVNYIRNIENNQFGVWEQIKNFTNSNYLLVFHDDDIMHPKYLEVVTSNIQKNPELAIICSGMKSFTNQPEIEIINDKTYYLLNNQKDFAYLLYCGFQLPFCSAVYKTEVFKRLIPKFNLYSKLFDRPFMINASEFGKALVLKGKYIHLRIHEYQDSNSIAEGLYINQLIELNKFYYKKLGDSFFNKYGRLFIFLNYNRLYNSYRWMGGKKSNYTFIKFLELNLINKSTSKKAIFFGFIFNYTIGVSYKFIKYLQLNFNFK